ncbi:P1 family peptidase, partial [Bacteroidota bacterium]
VGEELGKLYNKSSYNYSPDGSCMIVVCTDAPIDSRNLKRLAKRAMLGLAKTGGVASNGSGDYVIAISTAKENRIKYNSSSSFYESKTIRNDRMSPLFMAVIEATEEAIINSLFAAETSVGINGRKVEALPIPQVMDIMKKYNR